MTQSDVSDPTDTGNYCKVNLQGESRSESNALLCAESRAPLNLKHNDVGPMIF